MSNAEKPKRKLWQFHLTTAILLSLNAGLLLWKNTSWTLLYIRVFETKEDLEIHGLKSRYEQHHEGQGWPFWYHQRPAGFDNITWDPVGLVLDIIVGIGILAGIAIICEWLIRRREARKT